MKTCCCSTHCKKYFHCRLADINNEGINIVENFHEWGSGTYNKDEGCVVEHYCGELGDYKMFEPIKTKRMKQLNLNSIIKVVLSDYGKEVFYHRFDEVNKVIVKSGGKPIEPFFPKVDNDGYTEFQLWDFMNIYGKHMMMAAPEVLQHLNIYIKEEDLKEAN